MNDRSRPKAAPESPAKATIATVAHQTAAERDVWAWTAIHLNDGRVVSLAWLRGWPGAVAGRWSA